MDIRELSYKRIVFQKDAAHLGLLQHYLRYQYLVRIACSSPGKIAFVRPVIPIHDLNKLFYLILYHYARLSSIHFLSTATDFLIAALI